MNRIEQIKTLLKTTLLCITILTAPNLYAAEDLLIADFEGMDYGQWKTTGEAFGPGPARGTLPDQMHVDGFKGGLGSALAIVDSVIQAAGWRNQEDKKVRLVPIANAYFQGQPPQGPVAQ